MKSRKGNWEELFNVEDEEFELPANLESQEGDGIVFLDEAQEALNRLSQKANKRGKLMNRPRRAESWH